MGHLKANPNEHGSSEVGTKISVHLPVIGSRFNSRARSFEASCHSLLMVFGGGLPDVRINTVRKWKARRWVFSGLTKGTACEE